MSGKRGQITAFIIVGLVLLFSIIILSVMKDESMMFPGTPVQPELEPLAEYTIQCVEEVGESAIRLLGMGGGYLETPNEIAINPLEYVSIGPIKLPLWYYEGESRIPTKEGLETQISSYVVERINNCLNDYEDFQAQYDMDLVGEISAETLVTSESVDVTLTYPLKVVTKVEFKEMDLPPIRARIPIRLGKVFELAAAINEYENTEFFLEKLTNDWISTSGFQIRRVRPHL